VHLVGFGDRREAHNLPWLLAEHVADEVVLVQPLHDDDDGATAFVVDYINLGVNSVEEPIASGEQCPLFAVSPRSSPPMWQATRV